MATGTSGTVARQFHTQQIHFLRKSLVETGTTANQSEVFTVGVIPAGATILKPLSGVNVDVAYTSATNKLINIGTTANDDLYGTIMSVASIAFVPLDESVAMTVSEDTTIIATHALTGTAGSAGRAEVVIAYLPDIDG
jgi:hypothetical protein